MEEPGYSYAHLEDEQGKAQKGGALQNLTQLSRADSKPRTPTLGKPGSQQAVIREKVIHGWILLAPQQGLSTSFSII